MIGAAEVHVYTIRPPLWVQLLILAFMLAVILALALTVYLLIRSSKNKK